MGESLKVTRSYSVVSGNIRERFFYPDGSKTSDFPSMSELVRLLNEGALKEHLKNEILATLTAERDALAERVEKLTQIVGACAGHAKDMDCDGLRDRIIRACALANEGAT